MASEDGTTPNRTIGDRMVTLFDRLSETYDDMLAVVRNYTPYLVRTIEVVLATALFALLVHWIYLFYTAG